MNDSFNFDDFLTVSEHNMAELYNDIMWVRNGDNANDVSNDTMTEEKKCEVKNELKSFGINVK